MRKTIAEEEKNKEMEDLYLPPRRKNMQQNNADASEFKKPCHCYCLEMLKQNSIFLSSEQDHNTIFLTTSIIILKNTY